MIVVCFLLRGTSSFKLGFVALLFVVLLALFFVAMLDALILVATLCFVVLSIILHAWLL